MLPLLCGCAAHPIETMSTAQPQPTLAQRGTRLEDLTWQQAEARLTADAIVVIPIGAALKEHGPHLRLKNDLVLAEYFTSRVLASEDVLVAATLGYHFYPAFVDYPGSTSLRFETARDLTVDVVSSLAHHGPRRFYGLNTGVSTRRPLAAAAEQLAKRGILFTYSDFGRSTDALRKELLTQARGTHADEGETSMMLYIAPDLVDLSKAVKDDGEDKPGPLSRTPEGPGTYSPTGSWGDPTLATREKGRRIVERIVEGIHEDLVALRAAPLPPVEP